MASFLFRIGTLAAFAAALAAAAVPNRYARGEGRDQGRASSHALRASTGSGAAAPDPIGAEYVARVVGIADGDTIRVLHAGREVRVRLHGIDCPESRQPFGTRAKQFTGDLVFGRDVRIRVRDVDRYGRSVAEVVLADDGRMLNRELVAAGLAWSPRLKPGDSRFGARSLAGGLTQALRAFILSACPAASGINFRPSERMLSAALKSRS